MDPLGTQGIASFDSLAYDWHTAPMDTSAPPAGITPEDWAATPVAVQQFLLATLTVVALQQQQIAQLIARVADLEARLNQHSQNSSKPPSSDPPSAPPRPARVPRGRTPGAQAGHPRHDRPEPEPDQITTTRHHYPSACPTCGNDLTTHRHDACAIQTQFYAAIHTHVQAAPIANVDETGWKEAGKRRWLWVMVTALATCFSVATSRNGPALRHLLGTAYGGIVGSDRHRPYLALSPERHQLCWSHLVRNFQALVDRGGRGGVWGADFLALSHLVFRLWHLFREGTIDRALLQAAMAPIQQALHERLVQGARRCDAPESLCQELLAHEAALWTFVREAGVEPTNNAAEQALRPAVLWRKGCFGAHSAEGNTFVERILTVSATCAQQHRHLLTFLTAAVDAFWRGQPAPKLI
jgi:hypothetical protein